MFMNVITILFNEKTYFITIKFNKFSNNKTNNELLFNLNFVVL